MTKLTVNSIFLLKTLGENLHAINLGIGDDIEAEKQLLKIFPKCRMVGLDPIFESGKVYQEIGLFLQTGVGKMGSEKAILEASVYKQGSYVMENVTSQSFDKILGKLNEDVIDFLLFDAEGAEYNVIPALTR